MAFEGRYPLPLFPTLAAVIGVGAASLIQRIATRAESTGIGPTLAGGAKIHNTYWKAARSTGRGLRPTGTYRELFTWETPLYEGARQLGYQPICEYPSSRVGRLRAPRSALCALRSALCALRSARDGKGESPEALLEASGLLK
jgi:hypothetical protein